MSAVKSEIITKKLSIDVSSMRVRSDDAEEFFRFSLPDKGVWVSKEDAFFGKEGCPDWLSQACTDPNILGGKFFRHLRFKVFTAPTASDIIALVTLFKRKGDDLFSDLYLIRVDPSGEIFSSRLDHLALRERFYSLGWHLADNQEDFPDASPLKFELCISGECIYVYPDVKSYFLDGQSLFGEPKEVRSFGSFLPLAAFSVTTLLPCPVATELNEKKTKIIFREKKIYKVNLQGEILAVFDVETNDIFDYFSSDNNVAIFAKNHLIVLDKDTFVVLATIPYHQEGISSYINFQKFSSARVIAGKRKFRKYHLEDVRKESDDNFFLTFEKNSSAYTSETRTKKAYLRVAL